jgi:DNA repair protein RecO (recombination protein O)
MGAIKYSPKYRYIFEIKTVVINGEFPGIPAGEKLLDSTVYAISFIAGSPVEKLYTFTVTPPVLRELGRLAGLYCKNALDGHFKSLEIINSLC